VKEDGFFAAAAQDGSMPELWGGTDRTPVAIPDGPAREAGLVTTLLGLEVDAMRGRLRIAPVEPPLWSRLEVTGLQFARHRIDCASTAGRSEWASCRREGVESV